MKSARVFRLTTAGTRSQPGSLRIELTPEGAGRLRELLERDGGQFALDLAAQLKQASQGGAG